MLRIAEREQTPLLKVWAHLAQAIEAYAIGNFSGVGNHVEQLERYYSREEHSWAPFDPYVTVLGHAVYALWQLGYVDQALQKARQQLEIAQQLSSPNVAMARMTTCNLSMYLQDAEAMMSAANDMLGIGAEQQLPSIQAWGMMYKGIALILQMNNQEGMAILTQGMAAYLASGTHSSLGWYLSRLAIGYAQAGEVELALETIRDAFGAGPDEKMHQPELFRLQGDFLWMNGDPGSLEVAEENYRRAIAVSRQFEALAQELRAANRLGRLLQTQGRAGEVQALLAPVYAQFREGFGAPDLIEARKLLDEIEVMDTDVHKGIR
jgi:tetratricopeptide (TPR) repeat protein